MFLLFFLDFYVFAAIYVFFKYELLNPSAYFVQVEMAISLFGNSRLMECGWDEKPKIVSSTRMA